MSCELPTSRYYVQAEICGHDQQWLDGTTQRLVQLRLRTLDVTDTGETEGETDWVTFTLDGLDHLSAQLATAVASIRHWTPGQPPDPVGSNLGVVVQNVKA